MVQCGEADAAVVGEEFVEIGARHALGQVGNDDLVGGDPDGRPGRRRRRMTGTGNNGVGSETSTSTERAAADPSPTPVLALDNLVEVEVKHPGVGHGVRARRIGLEKSNRSNPIILESRESIELRPHS